MSPGAAAKQLGLTRGELRELEEGGAARPGRDSDGWRVYDEEEVERIRLEVIEGGLDRDDGPGDESAVNDFDDDSPDDYEDVNLAASVTPRKIGKLSRAVPLSDEEVEEVRRIRLARLRAERLEAEKEAELQAMYRRSRRIAAAADEFLPMTGIPNQGFKNAYKDNVQKRARHPSVARRIDQLDDVELVGLLAEWWSSGGKG